MSFDELVALFSLRIFYVRYHVQSFEVSYDKNVELVTASATITDFEFYSRQGADNTNNNKREAYITSNY